MKKFLSYILISLVIGANLLAPISVGWDKNNLEVKSNKAEAGWILDGTGDNPITITTNFAANDTSIKISVDVFWPEIGYLTSESIYVLKLSDTQTDPLKTIYDENKKVPLTSSSVAGHQVGDVEFTGLTPLKTYKFTVRATQNSTNFIQSSLNTLNTIIYTLIPISSSDQYLLKNTGEVQNPIPYEITTLSAGITTYTPQNVNNATMKNDAALLPDCAADFWNTIGGCFGQLLYWGIFQPTSFVFGLTGKLLDLSVDYSTKDTSYRSSFVVEGWGIVRDFCNMFFIFVLLYIAFKTILGLGASKTKEMVINVVIIGLLINFSLFATQVIIDASNILTRVFYNSQSIAIGPKINGVIQDQRGSNGEIKLSEALVAKINPQNLILQASKADNIQTNQTINQDQKGTNGISAKTFILVVILASIVNVVGLITFLMCSLIFISRVIGLWMAMIFAPIAFFSYTIPALQDTEMIGWKKWWPETLKMAFLAPVFIFFMYLIIKFLDTGLGLVINDSASGMNFILGIFIPFIFIMLLLTKAKDIAKKMSGTMGEKITNGLAAAGGIALGGAALGTAFLGRNVIGGGLAKASRSDSAMHLATQKFEHSKDLEKWEAGGRVSPKPVFTPPVAGAVIGKDAKGKDIKYKEGIGTSIGAALNAKQMKIGGVDFARSQMDETKKAAGLVDANGNLVDDSKLSGTNEKKMKDTFARTKRAETETQVRKGVNAKGDDILIEGHKGEEAYKSANRNEIADRVGKESTDNVDFDGKLTPTALRKVENELNIKLNAAVKIETDNQLAGNFDKLRTESKQKVGGVERAFSRTNTGSWDARKLSEGKSDQREGMFTKIPVALIAGIAMGVRGGLKSVGTSSGGVKVEGNFMKDLGNTISDSLKGMRVNVNLEHVGETKSSADAHGGVSGAHH